MRWNPKMGTLDRQAGFPRIALRISIARNPVSLNDYLSVIIYDED